MEVTKSLNLAKYYIQQYGKVVVISSDNTIVGISENIASWIGQDEGTVWLDTSFKDFAKQHFGYDAQKIMLTVDKVRFAQTPRQLILQSIRGQIYYLCIYRRGAEVFLEWELQKRKSISAHEMDELGFLFEKNPSEIWNSLCRAVQKLIHYEHVFILSVSETGEGQVVAEHVKGGRASLKGKHFSAEFITPDIISFYESRSYRYCPNLFLEYQLFYGLEQDIQLDSCSYLRFPHLHERYLQYVGVTSIIAFPILVNGNFWGLLVAQNKTEKYIDLQKRKLCSFVVQNAIGKYESVAQNLLLDRQEQIKTLELDLKGKLLFSKTVNCALVQSMHTLCELPKADGLVLYHKGDISTYGTCPTEPQTRQIVKFLQNEPERHLFKDHRFAEKYKEHIEGLVPFAGIMVLQVDRQADHYIIWFRKTVIQRITKIDMLPQEVLQINTTTGKVSRYETQEETICNEALPWTEDDLAFIINLDRLIENAILTKAQEHEKFNEEMISLNNELEMLTFTLSHDLKNPLSIVKMGVQFLETNRELTQEAQQKWHKNILEGVDNIEGIINHLFHLGKTNSYPHAKDPVPMAYMIRQLFEDAKILNNNPTCKITYGNLLPLLGEKSVLYQIFLNIIGNAVKYTSDRPLPKIQIESFQKEDHVIYTVQDNGIGIPEHQLSSIFDLFGRASNSKTFKGSGLGLCLVKRIMDKIGGQIELDSEVNVGTKINLIFPSLGDIPENPHNIN